MSLLVPSLSSRLPDPVAPRQPRRTRLPHPSTCTPSVMESCVRVVVDTIIVGSSSSPPPTDPTWGEREGGALPDRSGFKRRLWAFTATSPHPRPTTAAAGSVLSLREFRAPGSLDSLFRKLKLEMVSDACTPPKQIQFFVMVRLVTGLGRFKTIHVLFGAAALTKMLCALRICFC